jgi:hypothetical protein
MRCALALFFVLVSASCSDDTSPFVDADGGGKVDAAAGPCTDGEKTCAADEELHCRNGKWVSVQRCIAPKTCFPSLGCAECDPASQTACKDGNVHRCNANGTIGGLVETCLTEPCRGGTCSKAGCPSGTQLIYVVDSSYRLLSFSPKDDAHTFTEIGKINCPAGRPWPNWDGFTATPFSMSVDRQARAWVLFTSGEIFWVNTKTAQCVESNYQKGQQGLELFGMGFAADGIGSQEETLYVYGGAAGLIGGGAGKLAKLKEATMSLTPIGPLSGTNQGPELTGTGNAKLFGFFPGTGAFVGEIDKQTGHINQKWPIKELRGQVTAWAFAHWGGRFYIFATTPSAFGENSQVLRLDPQTGKVDKLLENSPYRIVGAGVSTCAPVIR